MKLNTVKDLIKYLKNFPENTKLSSESSSAVDFGETHVRSTKNSVIIVSHLPSGPKNGW